ncbi:mechanosensitive ion channel-like protein [Novosphingobium kunmingense]|uniref:Mechanosensitive ion channel-like protein n=1 Tax=Novosphingobium kunmingense TaxID=1211806 RepID=A0A2N0HKY0_9SPHN|nr:mechanosensitive ion channel domain-containing protein [Novosphingobium kunmingense]PKB19596.1 mechanosensitive ion channel-like protein [Novosphingobium kunmingense]
MAIEPKVPAAIVSRHQGLAEIVATLDSWGFDVGSARISVWTVLVAIVVVAALILFARHASRVVGRLLGRITGIDAVQRTLAEKLSGIVIWAVAFFVGIDLLGINLTALTVFSGAFGLAIGFGLQKTFGNMIAGIILLLDRSIKPGDVIAVNDGTNSVVGQVSRIGIRAVSVITRDKKEFLIPNENLMVNQVENWSYSSRDVRIRVPVGIGYGSDSDLAERLMIEAALETPRVLPFPKPVVLLTGFGENALQCEVRLWVDDPEEGVGNVRSDLLKRVLARFRDNGIALPHPQRDIHLRDWPVLRGEHGGES